MPAIGLGTWQSDPAAVADAVTAAIKVFFFSIKKKKLFCVA